MNDLEQSSTIIWIHKPEETKAHTMYLIKIIQNNKIGYYSESAGRHTATTVIAHADSFLFAHEALVMIEKLKKVNPKRNFSLEETF